MSAAKDYWESLRGTRPVYPTIDTRGVKPVQEESGFDYGDIPVIGPIIKNLADTATSQIGLQMQGAGAELKGLADSPVKRDDIAALGGLLSSGGEWLEGKANAPEREKYHPSQEWQEKSISDILSAPDTLYRYITDPRGFQAELGSGLGSAAEFALLARLFPGAFATNIASKVLNPTSKLLGTAGLNRASQAVGSNTAKELLGSSLQFGTTMGPAGALTNAATIIQSLKEQGKSDAEIAESMNALIGEELPADVAFAALTGNVVKGKLGDLAPRNAPAWQKALANASGIPLEGAGGYYSNVYQMILSDKYSGKPYGTLTDPLPNESTAGRLGILAGLPFAAQGAYQGYRNAQAQAAEDAQRKAKAQEDTERIGKVNVGEDKKATYDDDALYGAFRSASENFANRQERVARQSYREAQQENLTQKQAEIWDAAQYASARAKEKYGIDLSPELIYKQWAHEAGVNFDSPNARYNNNFGGLTQSEPNGEENKQPDGNNYYRHFNSVQDYAEAYVDDYIRHRPEISGVKNEREFAQVMHDTGYHTDSVDNYASDMEGITVPTSRTDGGQTNGGINFQTVLNTAKKNLNGKQMDNGTVGCVEAVTKILAHAHPEFQKMVDDGVVNTVEGENSLKSRLEKMGVEIVPFDESQVAQGDIIFYDGEQTYQHVLVADHVDEQGNWRVFGNSSSNNRVMEQPLYQGQKPAWIAKVSNLQGDVQSRASEIFSNRTRNDEAPQWQDYKQNEKPLFDINAEDETTRKLFEQYAEERLVNSTDRDTVNFFDGMFTADGNFQNTPENRDAIRERYGDDFIKWVTNQQNQQTTQEEKSAQTNPPKTQPPAQTNSPLRNAPVIETATKFLEQLRAKGDPKNFKTALELQTAISNGDIATVENILKQNNIAIPSPQTQTENVVKENTTPENVTKQKTSPLERQIKIARAPVATGSGNKNKRKKQGNAIIALAAENGIKISSDDVQDLQNGNQKVVQRWRDYLLSKGVLELPQTQETPQTQEQPSQPQQQTASQRKGGDSPPLDTTQQTASNQESNQSLPSENQQKIQAARENWENIKRGYQERGEQIQQQRQQQNEKDEFEDELQFEDEMYESRIQQAEDEEIQQQRQQQNERDEFEDELQLEDEMYESRIQQAEDLDEIFAGEPTEEEWTQEQAFREKQNRELQELEARQAEERRLRAERQAEDQRRYEEQQADPRKLYAEGKTKAARKVYAERQAKIRKILAEQQAESQGQQTESGLPITDEDLRLAMSDPFAVNNRKKQGRVLARILSQPQIKRLNNAIHDVAGLRTALSNGSIKAILAAQDILDNVIGEDTLAEKSASRTQRTAQRETENQKYAEQDEALFDDEMLESQMQHSEDLERTFTRTNQKKEKKRKRQAQQQAKRAEQQRNVQEDEQTPQSEDERDVFDLIPDVDELNDVETESEPQTSPKKKSKQSGKRAAKLREKFKTKTHPRIGAGLNRLIEIAASPEKSPERSKALAILELLEVQKITDEILDREEARRRESQKQTQSEDTRNVFDLIPDVDELNDVEEEAPQPQSQEAPAKQRKKSPQKSKPKRSKRAAKLHEKLKTDTHPLIGAYLDRLLKIAASREKSPERSNALSELELYEKREITDEMLDRAEKNLQEKQEQEEKSNGATSTSEKTETEKSSRTEENSDKDTVSRQTQTQEVSESTAKALEVNDELREKLHKKHPAIKECIDVLIEAGQGAEPSNKNAAKSWLNARTFLAILLTKNTGDVSLRSAAFTMHYIWSAKLSGKVPNKTAITDRKAHELFTDKTLTEQELYRQIGELLYPKHFSKSQSQTQAQEVSESKGEKQLPTTTEKKLSVRQWQANKKLIEKAIESPDIIDEDKILLRGLLKLMNAIEKVCNIGKSENLHQTQQFNVGKVLGDKKSDYQYSTDPVRAFLQGQTANNFYDSEVYYTGTHDLDRLNISPCALEKLVEKRLQQHAWRINSNKASKTVKAYLEMYNREDAKAMQEERLAQEKKNKSESNTTEQTRESRDERLDREAEEYFTKYEDYDTQDNPYFGAGIKTDALPLGRDERISSSISEELDKIAETYGGRRRGSAPSGTIAHYGFDTAQARDSFVRAVMDSGILETEKTRRQRLLNEREKITAILNDTKTQLHKKLDSDKYPELKDFVEREIAKIKPKTAEEAREKCQEILEAYKQIDADRLARLAAQELYNQWDKSNEQQREKSHSNEKERYLRKDEAAREILRQMENGELTPDEAYTELKHFLKAGKRKNLGKAKATESETKLQETAESQPESQPESQAQEKSKPVPAEKSEVKTRTRQTLFKGEKEIKEARQMIEKEVPAGTKVRVKAIPTTNSKEPIETHYIIGEGYIQRVDEDGNPIGKEYSRNRDTTTKFFVRNTKGNGYSVAELEIEYPNSQTETKTETKAESKPETKAESKPAEKTPYDEYHAKLKTDKHPHLKTWLDKLINGASSVRAALFKLRMQFDKETFTDNQLDNAEKNLIAYEKEHGELPDKLDFEEPRISREEIDAKIDAELHEAAKDRNVANAFKQLGATIKDGKITFADYESRNMCIEYMRSLQSNDAKNFGVGELTDAIKSVFSPENLNAVQKALSDFAKQIGVPVIFFRGDTNLHGAHRGGFSLYNVDAKFSHDFVYWHEFGHWLKNNQPKLFQQLLDAAEITDEQIAEKKKSRKDLTTDEEIKEEIICDAMSDMARRTGLLKQIGKKNPSLIERLVSWAQSMLRRFTDWFHMKGRGLNTEQRNRMFDAFGKVVRQIEDANGNRIFRYNRRTHEVEHIDGRKLKTVNISSETKASMTAPESDTAKFSMDTSDNSNESFLRRVRNKVSALFDTSSQNTRRNKAIKDTLSKLSGYRILFGHTNSDEVIVDDLQKIIQSKHAYDWEKLLPKVGGKIASNLNLDATEEMNNYIADWLLTGALNNNSADAKAFAKAMRDNPAQSELLQVVRDTFQEFADMTPTERIKSTIVRRQDKPLPQRAKEIISREEWIDDLNPLQKHVDRMIEQSSPEVADIIKKEVDPYKMARLLKGMGALADMMIGEHGDDLVKIRKALQTQYPNVNFDNFKTLSSIIKSVGGDLEGLEAYALAKLDKEIHEKNRAGGKYITPSFSEEADDAAIKEGEKKFGQAQKDLVEYSRTLLAMQYSAGLITQNKFYAYLNGWQNYIPTPRVFDEDETFDVADSFKQKQGSKRDTFSPIQKLAANTQVFLRQAERNKVKLQIATLARFGNFGNIIAEVEKPNPNIKNIIHFQENGKVKYLETPDLALVRAVESLQTQADGNVIIQALKVTMSFMRAAYTSLNPDFAAGNAFRDLADAYIHNRHLNANPILALLDVWRAGFKGIVTKDQDYYDWLASGGSQSGFITESANISQRAIENLTRDSRKGNYFSKAWNKFQYLIELSENVTRLNTYKAAKKNLAAKHGGAATITDMRLAALAARDASVDFARSGKSMRTVNKAILFSNAAVQGLWQWGEKLRPSKLKTKEGQKEFFSAAFRAVMMGVMPAIIQSALNYGDDDRREKYEKRYDWEKDMYWIYGDGAHLPKGMDLGIRLLSTITDEAIDWLVKNDPVEWNRIARNLGGGFPSLTATIFTPALESYANYSIFRDAPIVPYREQSLPKYLQYGTETSPVAKKLGEVINESPRMIDHLISSYLGFLGRFATNPSLDIDRIPVVRRFFFDPDKNPKIVKDYYNALNEQEELYRGYKFERDRGKKVDLPEDYDAGLHKRLKAAQKQMQALSKQERKLIEDEKLSSDEQKAKLRELEKRRVALCEKVFKRAQ